MKPTKNDPREAAMYFQEKLAFTTGPLELSRWIDAGEPVTVVDVRRAEDFAKGHIPGAVSLPKEDWATLRGVSPDRLNVVYCYSQVCHLAAAAAVVFARNGCSVMELEGGFEGWKDYSLKVETAEMAGVKS